MDALESSCEFQALVGDYVLTTRFFKVGPWLYELKLHDTSQDELLVNLDDEPQSPIVVDSPQSLNSTRILFGDESPLLLPFGESLSDLDRHGESVPLLQLGEASHKSSRPEACSTSSAGEGEGSGSANALDEGEIRVFPAEENLGYRKRLAKSEVRHRQKRGKDKQHARKCIP